MNSDNRRSTVTLGLLAIIGLVISLVYAFGYSNWNHVTPLFGLLAPYNFLLVAFTIPMIGCIITAILMPRLVAPLFLRVKGKVLSKYKNAYISVKPQPIQFRQWLGRAGLTALLILGLLSILVNVIDPLLFMNPEQLALFPAVPQLSPSVTLPLAGFIAPIAFGLWATSWAMEDAGLMHYSIPESDDEYLYEIEPVFRRFSSYLKGYAGLASVIFISWVIVLLVDASVPEMAVFITLLVPIFSILQTIPGYFVYSRLSKYFLISNLTEINRVSKSDLIA
jgi:hypothetical protein